MAWPAVTVSMAVTAITYGLTAFLTARAWGIVTIFTTSAEPMIFRESADFAASTIKDWFLTFLTACTFVPWHVANRTERATTPKAEFNHAVLAWTACTFAYEIVASITW